MNCFISVVVYCLEGYKATAKIVDACCSCQMSQRGLLCQCAKSHVIAAKNHNLHRKATRILSRRAEPLGADAWPAGGIAHHKLISVDLWDKGREALENNCNFAVLNQ